MDGLELDYTDIQMAVEELLPQGLPVTFAEFVRMLVGGDTGGLREILYGFGKWLVSGLVFPVENGLHLFAVLLAAALLTNFSRAFSKNGVSQIGILCIYLLLGTYAAAGFAASLSIVEEGVKQLCRFVEILLPMYCISIAFLTGSVTAGGYYQGSAFAIGALEFAVRYLLLPMAQMYLLVSFASSMQKKPLFSRLLDLLKQVFSWIHKTVLGIVVAMGAVQGFLLPAIDSLKRKTLLKTAGAIPGVGNLLSGAWETVIGAGLVLKNAIGIAGVVVLFMIAAVPLLKVGLQYLMYKVLAAVAEPITEETLLSFLSHIGTAHRMLFRVLSLSLLLFLLLLVVMTSITA